MFQFIISIITLIIENTINSRFKLISKLGYFIYEIKTDMLVSMFRRQFERTYNTWCDIDLDYIVGAALYYNTFEEMLAHATQCMKADASLFPNVEKLDAPCGCSYTLDSSGAEHHEHEVIGAMTTHCMEEMYPEEEVGKDRLRKTSTVRYEDMHRARQPRDKGHKN